MCSTNIRFSTVCTCRDVWRAWRKQHANVLMNPEKKKVQKEVETDTFQFPASTHYVATGDTTMLVDWSRILDAATAAGVYPAQSKKEEGMNVVVFVSVPWGVLERTRATYQLKMGEEEASDHEDVELTDTQLGNFASHACAKTPKNTPMILHLPPLVLGRYASIMEANGWEATRNPIAITTKPGSKVNLKSLHVWVCVTRPDA